MALIAANAEITISIKIDKLNVKCVNIEWNLEGHEIGTVSAQYKSGFFIFYSSDISNNNITLVTGKFTITFLIKQNS